MNLIISKPACFWRNGQDEGRLLYMRVIIPRIAQNQKPAATSGILPKIK